MRLFGRFTLVAVMLTLAACGSKKTARYTTPPAPAHPSHIHGLGVNPADGALFVASHEGLFESKDGRELARVGDSAQDTMGFAVIGPDHFLASGHPDPQTPGPPLLGLISSKDGGREWDSLVLRGQADLHVIRPGRKVFYAQDATENRLFEGVPGTSGLSERTTPRGTTIDLAVDPRDDKRVFATTDHGFFVSRDSARSWRRVDRSRTGLLAFIGSKLIMVDGSSRVSSLAALGRKWDFVGTLPGPPVALTSHENELVAAVADGSVYSSWDSGETWTMRIKGTNGAHG